MLKVRNQTEKLSNILKDINKEIFEEDNNSKYFENNEERLNRIKKVFDYIEKQMNQYVSNFSFDENSKKIIPLKIKYKKIFHFKLK